MGRPPSNGGPSFRFNPAEVAEMEGILQAHNCLVPQRELLTALAEKFSNSAERSGKPAVQMKQVWNWFQNRRYALRAKSAKPPVKLNVSPMPQHDLTTARNVPQAPQLPSVPAANLRNVPQVPQPVPTPTVQSAGRNGSDTSQMEFEAKSARDGAWYDVATFLSHRSVETSDPEVLVRFAGFGPEEDEWVNVRKHVRQRSLPCESSECVAVLPGDLILCFQEGKEQALYFDAHVLDAQRRRHDVRGCRCRFLVRYDHDQSEEIVPLRKVCRRPETDYRMQQLHAESANMKQNKIGSEHHTGNSMKAYPSAEATSKPPKTECPAETILKPANVEAHGDSGPLPASISHANIPVATSGTPTAPSSETLASATAPSPHSNVSAATTMAADANSGIPGATTVVPVVSSVAVALAAAPIANSSVHGATVVAPVPSSVPVVRTVAPVANSSVPGAPIASSVWVAPAVAPVADSSFPAVPTITSAANSSVPTAPVGVAAANSSFSTPPTAEPPIPHSSVPMASTAEAPASNSSVPVTVTAEGPVTTNSRVEAPIASTVPAVTEIKISLEKVSESGPADSVDNTNAQSANLAMASDPDTSTISEERPGENMQLG